MAHREDPNTPQPLASGDENEDRRWVIRALMALILITGFFVAVGRLDVTSSTAGHSNSAPANPGPSAGSTSLPKGPSR
jgi:hypothetical protein